MSVIIPAYNEQDHIGPTLDAIRDHAVRIRQTWQVVVDDDGCTDATADRVAAGTWQPLLVQLLRNDQNRGKGYSVRRGMLAAAGSVLLMYDADRSTPVEAVEKLLPWLDRGFAVVIGSRDMPDSVLDPPQPRPRRFMAAVFRGIRRRLMLHDLRDTQCGFKCFRRDAARDVFSRQAIDGWVFDCEVLGIAHRLGHRVKEVGIVWRNNPPTAA